MPKISIEVKPESLVDGVSQMIVVESITVPRTTLEPKLQYTLSPALGEAPRSSSTEPSKGSAGPSLVPLFGAKPDPMIVTGVPPEVLPEVAAPPEALYPAIMASIDIDVITPISPTYEKVASPGSAAFSNCTPLLPILITGDPCTLAGDTHCASECSTHAAATAQTGPNAQLRSTLLI